MAKKLNKKVVLAGTVVLLIMFVLVLVVGQQKDIFTSQPKLLDDGDAAAARGDYETARMKYLRVRARAKNDRIVLEALHKLTDVYLATEDWMPFLGVLQEILKLEPNDLAVRYARLKYWYIIADGGVEQAWDNIESQASEFLEIVERDNLLGEDTAKWEKPQYEKVGLVHPPLCGSDGVQRVGQYLYLLRGRARLGIVLTGAVTEPDKMLEEAIKDLQKAEELEPTNADVVWWLAQAFIAKGDMLASRGSFDEREKADKFALEILEKAVEDSPEVVQGHINRLAVAQSIAMAEDPSTEKLASFEPQYRQLVERFPQQAATHAVVARFYRNLGPSYLDRAVEEAEKARELEPNDVMHALSAADAYNFKAVVENDKSSLEKAISLLDQTLKLPGVQLTEGPRQFQHLRDRAMVYSYLGGIYLERLLDPEQNLSEQQKQEWLDKAEGIVHEIEQIRGSGEDPTVVKWQGMLALAKGDKTAAVQKLYAVYRQLEAANRMDTQLAYVLAKTFEQSVETGATNDFFTSALRLQPQDLRNRGDSIDRRWPSALLDEAEIMLRLRGGPAALTVVNYFERISGANARSRKLKVRALTLSGRFEEAEAALNEGGIDSVDRLKLESQMLQRKIAVARVRVERQRISEGIDIPDEDIVPAQQGPVDINQLEKQIELDNDRLAANITELVSTEPNSVSDTVVQGICRRYRQQGKEDRAREVADVFLRASPDSVVMRTYVRTLDAGGELSEQEQTNILRQVIEEISEPVTKAAALGAFYAGQDEPNEAAVQFRKVLELAEQKGIAANDELIYQARAAISFLSELAIRTKDWDMAEKLVDIAQRYDLDQCNGDHLRARLSEAKGDYETALKQIEQCAERRPVSSQVLTLRGHIKEALGRTNEAIADMKQAAFFNPLNGEINKMLAVALYKRNAGLGSNVTTDQFLEAKEAIERAIGSNQNDTELLSFYAEFMFETKPQTALAIRQRLFRRDPTVNNAVLLGNMAFKLAEKKLDESEKQALMQMASTSYQKALSLDPDNQAAVTGYANFCRAVGQSEQAERLITESQDENLKWRYYLSVGQNEKAKQIMDRLYVTEPNNALLLRGLLGVAQTTLNQDDTKRYSEALCAVEGSKESKLIQVQALLEVGLISEAQLKLDSVMEEYPNEPLAQFLHASLLMRQGKLDEALVLANKGLESDQTNARGWLLRGEINRQKGNAPQAINDLTKSKSLEDSPSVRITLARAYIAANKVSDAIIELSPMVDDPTAPDQGRLLLEALYAQTGNYPLLRSFYERMMKQFPNNIVWINKAASVASQLGDFDSAERLFATAWDQSIQQGRGDIVALDGYITSLVKGEKLQQALDVGAKYVDSEFATVALVGMAMAKSKMNDRAAAVENFRRAADKAQDNPRLASSVLSVMYDEIGPDEVERYCIEKLAADSESLVANYVLYKLAQFAGDYNKAVGFLDKCISVTDPNSEDGLSFLVEKASLLSAAYEKYSDNSYVQQAIATYQQLLESAPEDVRVLNNLAYLLAVDGKDLNLAMEYAQKAFDMSPDNAGVLDTYAYVLYKNGRFEEAAENERAALQHYESQQAYAPAEVYGNLGMILEKLGQKDEARSAYEKALEIGKTLSEKKVKEIEEAVKRLGE